MHLPTPQFSRLVTILAFDLTNPALDSMILAWDHIATRFLKRISPDRALAGKVESIRLLAIHDAVHAVFHSGAGCIFTGPSNGKSLDAALAATAQASHDVLASVFNSPEERAELGHTLEESLSLIQDAREKAAGAATGADSAATFAQAFGPLAPTKPEPAAKPHESAVGKSRPVLRLAKNPDWRFDWQRTA